MEVLSSELCAHFLYKCLDGHARCPQYLTQRTPIKFAMEGNGDGTVSRSSEPHMTASCTHNFVAKAAQDSNTLIPGDNGQPGH